MYDVVSTRADEEGVSPERLTRKLCQRESHRHYHLTTQHQQEIEHIPERHHAMEGRESGGTERVQRDVLKEGHQSPIAVVSQLPVARPPVSVTGSRECIHLQRGYQLIPQTRRATDSDVGGTYESVDVHDPTGYKVFNTKIYSKLLPAIPQPRVAKSLFSLWAPARLTLPHFIPHNNCKIPLMLWQTSEWTHI